MSPSPSYVKLSQSSELICDEVEYFIKSSDCEDALRCRSDIAGINFCLRSSNTRRSVRSRVSVVQPATSTHEKATITPQSRRVRTISMTSCSSSCSCSFRVRSTRMISFDQYRIPTCEFTFHVDRIHLPSPCD